MPDKEGPTPPDTMHRRIPEGYKVVDLSLRGEIRTWFERNLKEKFFKRALGVVFYANPNSRVIITAPHGQTGITVYNPEEVTAAELIKDTSPPWESEHPRIGKAVLGAIKETAKPSSGMGDSLSLQLATETLRGQQSIPNFAFPTLSQATLETNTGKHLRETSFFEKLPQKVQEFFATLTEKIITSRFTRILRSTGPTRMRRKDFESSEDYKKASAILTAFQMLENFRGKLIELGLINQHPKLLLNIHTAFDRSPEKGGNPDIEIILGTRHGLSCDFATEITLARFLKAKGFKICLTSLFDIPSEDAEIASSSLKPKEALPGEDEAAKSFKEMSEKFGVSSKEFEDDESIRTLGRLRGTTFNTVLHDVLMENGVRLNAIQLEITRSTMAASSRRLELAQALAEFCEYYEQGIEGLSELNERYNLESAEVLTSL